MLTLEGLAASLTLPEIKELERIKMAEISAASAERVERVRRKQEELRKLEQEEQQRQEETINLFAQVEEADRMIAPLVEAAQRQTFTIAPAYPVNKNGNPVAITSKAALDFMQKAQQHAAQ